MSDLRVFQEEPQIEKGKVSEAQPTSFNPLSMGLLFFGFSLALWGTGQITDVNLFVFYLALVVSVVCGIAVVIAPLRTFLRRRGWRALLPFGMVAFFFGYFMNLLSAITQNGGIVSITLFCVGLAWLILVFMVMSKGLPSAGQYLVIALFVVPAVVYFYQSQFLSGLVLLIFAAGVFSSRWLNIEYLVPL